MNLDDKVQDFLNMSNLWAKEQPSPKHPQTGFRPNEENLPEPAKSKYTAGMKKVITKNTAGMPVVAFIPENN